MGKQEWINNMIYFQARCRGYLMRRELKCVQAEYEDIVKELEGSLEHLRWRGEFLPKPHFTDADTERDFFRYPRPKQQNQECVEEGKVQDETPCLHSEVLVPEKDKDVSCGPERGQRETSTPAGGATQHDGSHWDGVADTNALGMSVLQHAPLMMKDVAHTPEALKQHRNSLAMELLWIQQAIASRKKYLTLKQTIETS